VEARIDSIPTELKEELHFSLLSEYNKMIEELRSRLNTLGTTLFLLYESTNLKDKKVRRYVAKIENEMERIRQLVSAYPKEIK
jgi:predicted nucleic acid-binding protein